jgi:hypothetical protein
LSTRLSIKSWPNKNELPTGFASWWVKPNNIYFKLADGNSEHVPLLQTHATKPLKLPNLSPKALSPPVEPLEQRDRSMARKNELPTGFASWWVKPMKNQKK